jgi:tight adherence protein C
MNHAWLLTATGVGTLLVVIGASVLLHVIVQQKRLVARVQMTRGQAPAPVGTRQDVLKGVWARLLAGLGQLILLTGLLSARTRADLEATLASSGLRGRTGLEVFIGAKLGLLFGLPLLAVLVLRGFHLPPMVNIAIPFAAAVAGLLAPDMLVRSRRKQYIQRVERGLPDALDLLVICAQAGLGLKTAIARVAEEMQEGQQAIGMELALTANELELVESRLALQNMGSRTGVEGLVRLANTLLQSMQYGTPLTDSMRILSAEMRNDTLTRFESRAARLSVLLTMPMIIFILPCLFIVIGGPAAIQVLRVGSQ